MRVLVTGANGFVGRHLTEFIQRRFPQCTLYLEDAADLPTLLPRVADLQPDRVFHLAPDRPTLIQAVRRTSPRTRLLVLQNGWSPADMADALLWSQGLHAVGARLAHVTGPGQSEAFVESHCARQIACIENGLQQPYLRVTTRNVRGDVTDVRDAVRGLWMALDQGAAGQAYAICQGASISSRTLVERLLRLSMVTITTLPSDMVPPRSAECRPGVPPPAWEPEIPLDVTLHDLLSDWRTKAHKLRLANVGECRRWMPTPGLMTYQPLAAHVH